MSIRTARLGLWRRVNTKQSSTALCVSTLGLPDNTHLEISQAFPIHIYTLQRIENGVVKPCKLGPHCSATTTSPLSLHLQATQIRLALAKIYEEDQQWRLSAEVLCGIPMDSGQK